MLLTFRVSEEETKGDRARAVTEAEQGDPEFSSFPGASSGTSAKFPPQAPSPGVTLPPSLLGWW